MNEELFSRPRKLAILRVHRDAVVALLTAPTGSVIEVTEGAEIPGDAKCVQCSYEPKDDCFVLVFEHPSFDEMHDGMCLPYVAGPSMTVTHPWTRELHERGGDDEG